MARDDLASLRRLAIACTGLALPTAAISIGAGLLAVDGNLEALTFGNPDVILPAGVDAAPLWRLSMLTDVFYSYLLLAPLALYLHRRLRERGPWLADLGLAGAMAYIFLGAAGAASLGIAGSSLIESYANADEAARAAITASFVLLRDIFYFGVWQTIDPIAAGTWVFSVGWLLRGERPSIGRVLIVLAGGLWAGSVATMLGIHSLAALGVIVAGAVAVWLLWSGSDRLRHGFLA
jgi:hypothetical protein